jgi:hypothetical protein
MTVPKNTLIGGDQPEDVEKDQNLRVVLQYIQVRNEQNCNRASYCPSSGDRDKMSITQGGILPTSLRSTSNMIFKPISSNSIRSKAVSPTFSLQTGAIPFNT